MNYPFLTQKEWDIETGLDYFGARYLASTQGRFTSTDPIIITTDRLVDPQGINLYSYARNNPLRFTDPTGEDIALTGNEEKQKQGLERIRNMLGDERFNLVDFNQQDIPGLGTVTVMNFGSEENRLKFEAIGNNPGEIEFTQAMADIIGSKDHVEFQVSKEYSYKGICLFGVCERVTTSVYGEGGGVTVNKDESWTGNVQIFVAPDPEEKASANMEIKRRMGIKISSDGNMLMFTKEQVDAHEFGHAHNTIRRGMKVENPDKALRLENILRVRQRSPNTRLVH